MWVISLYYIISYYVIAHYSIYIYIYIVIKGIRNCGRSRRRLRVGVEVEGGAVSDADALQPPVGHVDLRVPALVRAPVEVFIPFLLLFLGCYYLLRVSFLCAGTGGNRRAVVYRTTAQALAGVRCSPRCCRFARTFCRGFQGYCLKYTVKGPQFKETRTHILSNQKFIEESQNDS